MGGQWERDSYVLGFWIGWMGDVAGVQGIEGVYHV